MQNILCGDVYYGKAQRCKKGFPFLVVFNFVIMGTAVHLNHCIAIQAVKINDEVSDDLLAVKIVAAELAVFDLLP